MWTQEFELTYPLASCQGHLLENVVPHESPLCRPAAFSVWDRTLASRRMYPGEGRDGSLFRVRVNKCSTVSLPVYATPTLPDMFHRTTSCVLKHLSFGTFDLYEDSASY